ncbi:hypothetical protein HOLDEFILI_04097, partial [Holdemania filiformis DSM 12042]
WFPMKGTFFCFCAGVKGRSFASRVGFDFRTPAVSRTIREILARKRSL